MVRIITDSAADFEPQELQRLNIQLIPLIVRFGETEYADGRDLSKAEFYDKLLTSGDFSTTSQPSPAVLESLFTAARDAGDEAIYITISSGISGTYQTARMVCEDLEIPGCYVLDSRNATGGQRQLVEQAVRLRDSGMNAAQILEALEAFRQKIALFACINTLEYLYKGGRVSHTVYKIGNMAQIKPVIHVDEEGKIAIPAKAMGMRKGMDTLCKYLDTRKPDPAYPLYVMYTNNRSVALTLAERLRTHGYAVPDEQIIGVGAAIGTHICPDACGLVYVEG